MAKKPVQFRFDENFHKAIFDVSQETGASVSEIVRNSISLYLTLYDRAKGKDIRFFIKGKNDDNSCEIILPWLKY